MQEIWKDIPNYEGMYQVSNLGNVKSVSRIILRGSKYPFLSKEKNLKQSKSGIGYLKVALCKNGIAKTISIHCLVAMAFLNYNQKGKNGYEIDHINNIKSDNRAENLQLITQRENASKDRNGTSQYTGVSWNKKAKKWIVFIVINNKHNYLGLFTNEYDAHLAYQEKLKQIKI